MSPANSRTISRSQSSMRSRRIGEIALSAGRSRIGPLWSADRSEQNRISRTAARQSLGRQRRAKTLDGGSAKSKFAKFKFMFERFRTVSQYLYRGMRHFRPDSVARQYRDGLAHSSHDCVLPYF